MGVMRILAYFNMFDVNKVESQALAPPPSTILCSKGFWVYTNTGGVLEVYPQVGSFGVLFRRWIGFWKEVLMLSFWFRFRFWIGEYGD